MVVVVVRVVISVVQVCVSHCRWVAIVVGVVVASMSVPCLLLIMLILCAHLLLRVEIEGAARAQLVVASHLLLVVCGQLLLLLLLLVVSKVVVGWRLLLLVRRRMLLHGVLLLLLNTVLAVVVHVVQVVVSCHVIGGRCRAVGRVATLLLLLAGRVRRRGGR